MSDSLNRCSNSMRSNSGRSNLVVRVIAGVLIAAASGFAAIGCKAEPRPATAPATTTAAAPAPVTVNQSPSFDPDLYRAAENGARNRVDRRLDAGAPINGQNPNNGRTAMHAAANNGHKKMVTHLLQRGADPNIKDSAGNTPLHLAAAAGHDETVEALVGSTNLTIRNNAGKTAREVASSRVISYFPPQ